MIAISPPLSPDAAANQTAPNAVTDWATLVQPAVVADTSAGIAHLHHTMVMLAMYDATMAILGGYTPYAARIHAAPGADVRAAVATAAFLTARARAARCQHPYLDEQYASYLADLPDNDATTGGIHAGQRAAGAILALRADDRPDSLVPSVRRWVPALDRYAARNANRYSFALPLVGAFEPVAGAPHDHSHADRTVPSPLEGGDVWLSHPDAGWPGDLVGLAVARELSLRQSARLFAIAYTASADAMVARLRRTVP